MLIVIPVRAALLVLLCALGSLSLAYIVAEGETHFEWREPERTSLLPMGPITFRSSHALRDARIEVTPHVLADVSLDGRILTLRPLEPLRPGGRYVFTIESTFESGDVRIDVFTYDVDPLVDLWVYVKLDDAMHWVYVFEGSELVKRMLASGGKPGDETPAGVFKIQNRGHHFWSNQYGEGAYYWVRIFGNYLFHSVPVDIRGNIIAEEAAKLGCPASHGCVRMSMPDARWFYENVPDGTLVVIDRN